MPYLPENKDAAVIFHPNEIPDDFKKLRLYAPGIFPINQGGQVYAQLFLGLNSMFIDTMAQIRSFCKQKQWGVYTKELQVPRVTRLGWLFYGHPKIDIDYLKQQCFNRSGIEYGIRWMTIPQSQPNGEARTSLTTSSITAFDPTNTVV